METGAKRETEKCKIHPEEMLRKIDKTRESFPSPVMRLIEFTGLLVEVKYKSIITKLTFLLN